MLNKPYNTAFSGLKADGFRAVKTAGLPAKTAVLVEKAAVLVAGQNVHKNALQYKT